MSIGFFLNSNLSYIKLLITLKPTKSDWDSTVVHVSHMPYAADRPHPENGDYAKVFLYWCTHELCCLVWLKPVLTVPNPVSSLEWITTET